MRVPGLKLTVPGSRVVRDMYPAMLLIVFWNLEISQVCEGLPQSAKAATALDRITGLVERASHACLPSSPKISQDLHLTAKETEMLGSLCQRTDLKMPEMMVRELRRSIPAGVLCNVTDWCDSLERL